MHSWGRISAKEGNTRLAEQYLQRMTTVVIPGMHFCNPSPDMSLAKVLSAMGHMEAVLDFMMFLKDSYVQLQDLLHRQQYDLLTIDRDVLNRLKTDESIRKMLEESLSTKISWLNKRIDAGGDLSVSKDDAN